MNKTLASGNRVILFLMITLIIVLPSFGTSKTLISDDFDRADGAVLGGDWVEFEELGSTVEVKNNVAYFNLNDMNMKPVLSTTFAEQSAGTLTWSFTMNWRRVNYENIYELLIQLGNGMTNSSTTDGAAVALRYGDDNSGFTSEEGFGYVAGTQQTQVAQITGTNSISVTVDLDSKSYSISVNGVQKAVNVPFCNNISSINQMRIVVNGMNGNYFSGQTFDNILLTSSTSYLPLDGSQAMEGSIDMNGNDVYNASILEGEQVEAGAVIVDGTVNAEAFVGDGSGLTNLPLVQGSIGPQGPQGPQGEPGPNVVNSSTNIENSVISFSHLSQEALDQLVEYLKTYYTVSSMKDERDGKIYKVVKIGPQTWMAQNLNYVPASKSYCYDDNLDNCDTYGRLYEWGVATADDHGNGMDICPNGWHLPSLEEWREMAYALGNDPTNGPASEMLKARSWNGSDFFGFTGLPAGVRRFPVAYTDLELSAVFWTASIDDDMPSTSIRVALYTNFKSVRWTNSDRREAYSVRCLENY
ncbi:MAG: fibrobacter succinogenes major paralogous domain-containing protein [Fibrobacteria bacterium]|nr:fibrobacter succinogenes major paralogous domain-containing protein [Fibrobacteria bacterium]